MGKIFLRRAQGNSPLVPYSLETDIDNKFLKTELGDVVIHIPSFPGFPEPRRNDREFYSIGLADTGRMELKRVLAVVPIGNKVEEGRQLTEKTYKCVLNYGKKIAESLPEKADFIIEVGEAVKIPSSERL